MKKGVIKFFNKKSGYGFISPEDSRKDIFFHISGVPGKEEFESDDEVTFEEKEGKKGLTAVNVKPA